MDLLPFTDLFEQRSQSTSNIANQMHSRWREKQQFFFISNASEMNHTKDSHVYLGNKPQNLLKTPWSAWAQ